MSCQVVNTIPALQLRKLRSGGLERFACLPVAGKQSSSGSNLPAEPVLKLPTECSKARWAGGHVHVRETRHPRPFLRRGFTSDPVRVRDPGEGTSLPLLTAHPTAVRTEGLERSQLLFGKFSLELFSGCTRHVGRIALSRVSDTQPLFILGCRGRSRAAFFFSEEAILSAPGPAIGSLLPAAVSRGLCGSLWICGPFVLEDRRCTGLDSSCLFPSAWTHCV